MRKVFLKRDKEIQAAFQIYGAAKVQSVKRQAEKFCDGGNSGTGEKYIEAFEENRAEDKIYRMIEKLPIENPRKKARKIWIGSVTVVVLCILAGCLVHYNKEKPVRITKTLQEVYQQSGKRMEEGTHNPLVTENGMLYQCHYLTKEEQQRIEERGITYKRIKENATGDFSEGRLRLYRIADRKSHQFIIIKDGNGQILLGKFIGYQYWRGLAVNDNIDLQQEKKCYGTKEILEQAMGIYSSEDIRSVTLERYKAVSKENPEKLVSIWTGREERKWFYHFFSKYHQIWTPSPAGENTGEEIEHIKEVGMPVTIDNKLYHWREQVLQKIPEKAFYLVIENRLHEKLILGLLLENEKAELWIEPLEEWKSKSLESGSASACNNGRIREELAQADERNGIICLEKEEQKELFDMMQKVLAPEGFVGSN